MAGLAGVISRSENKKELYQSKLKDQVVFMLNKISYRGSEPNEIIEISNKKYSTVIGITKRETANGQINDDDNQISDHFLDGKIDNIAKIISDTYSIAEYDSLKRKGLSLILTDFNKNTISKLNGQFALVFYDQAKDVYLLRDFLGRKPLYYTFNNKDRLYFASEVKSLIGLGGKIFILEPGHYIKNLDTPKVFKDMTFDNYVDGILSEGLIKDINIDNITDRINELLLKSIEKRIPAGNKKVKLGTWLSGGLDSSVIAGALKEFSSDIFTFSVGYKGSPDLEAARLVAKHLGTIHAEYELNRDILFSSIPETIYALESFDAPLVRSTLGNMIVSKLSSKSDVIFSGEGGDEIFAGYNYFLDLESQQEIQTELIKAIKSLHNTALQRVDRVSNVNGVNTKLPMLDEILMEYVLRIPPELKLNYDKQLTKDILRKVAEKYLPASIVWRPKDKFWEGSGILNTLTEKIDIEVSENEYENNKSLENGFILRNKEEYYYYKVFREFFADVDFYDFLSFTRNFN